MSAGIDNIRIQPLRTMNNLKQFLVEAAMMDLSIFSSTITVVALESHAQYKS